MVQCKKHISIKIGLLLLSAIIFSLEKTKAQNFVNPDLNGTITVGNDLPTNWLNVPYTDPICLANNNGWDSPDLTNFTLPDSAHGIIGNPYSGATFVSGMRGDPYLPSTAVFQEGIMQTVSGFTIGNAYKINFHQAVVKQFNCLDPSGIWLVYLDSILIGITAPTYSNAGVFSTSFIWESRDVYFTATDTIHTLKFLPSDDDLDMVYSTTNPFGSIRMGIDSIEMSFCFPGFDLGNDTTICTGDTLNFNVATAGATYIWQDNSMDSIFNVTQAGTYWVQVATSTCSISDTIIITNNYLPVVNLGNDTILCEGNILNLDVTTPNATYLWQDNSINNSFNVLQQGSYWVVVTNNCGTITDTINIIFDTLIVNLGDDTTLCQSQIINLDATNFNATYLWQDNSSNPTFSVFQAGQYWVEVTRNSCANGDTIVVSFDSVPSFSLGPDTTICENTSLMLNATTQNGTYLWQDNSSDSILVVSQPNTYWVQVTNNCGTRADTLEIILEDCDTLFINTIVELIIPNVFSPNTDGENDVFSIEVMGIKELSVVVYNRWGQKVWDQFTIKDIQESRITKLYVWDGRTNAGVEVPEGVYYYIIEYFTVNDETESAKGTITLFK